jgi:hypothetical protein
MWFIFETIFKKLLRHIPLTALTNYDLGKYVKFLQIPNFRGIFMRNKLPKKIKSVESGIINLDDSKGVGTHWTAYIKKKNQIIYFDSYGNLRPPTELITYFLSDKNNNVINYNYHKYQTFDATNCGQLCLKFLYNNT